MTHLSAQSSPLMGKCSYQMMPVLVRPYAMRMHWDNKLTQEHFTIAELSSELLPEMTNIAKRQLVYDDISEELIQEKSFASPDFDSELSLGCFCDNVLAGYLVGISKPNDMAWIRLMTVHPDYANRGAGSLLLSTFEKVVANRGVKTVSVGDSTPNYLMPGMDYRYTAGWCFLKKNGYYLVHTNQNLIAPIKPSFWPELPKQIEQLAADNIIVRRATADDMKSLLPLLETLWPGWIIEVKNTFDNSPISTFVAVTISGEYLGFSSYQGNNKCLPWFGPIGTSPLARGKGIGGCLFRLCLLEMAKQGFDSTIIPWVGPVRFYVNYSNAKIDRAFYVHRKTFE